MSHPFHRLRLTLKGTSSTSTATVPVKGDARPMGAIPRTVARVAGSDLRRLPASPSRQEQRGRSQLAIRDLRRFLGGTASNDETAKAIDPGAVDSKAVVVAAESTKMIASSVLRGACRALARNADAMFPLPPTPTPTPSPTPTPAEPDARPGAAKGAGPGGEPHAQRPSLPDRVQARIRDKGDDLAFATAWGSANLLFDQATHAAGRALASTRGELPKGAAESDAKKIAAGYSIPVRVAAGSTQAVASSFKRGAMRAFSQSPTATRLDRMFPLPDRSTAVEPAPAGGPLRSLARDTKQKIRRQIDSKVEQSRNDLDDITLGAAGRLYLEAVAPFDERKHGARPEPEPRPMPGSWID